MRVWAGVSARLLPQEAALRDLRPWKTRLLSQMGCCSRCCDRDSYVRVTGWVVYDVEVVSTPMRSQALARCDGPSPSTWVRIAVCSDSSIVAISVLVVPHSNVPSSRHPAAGGQRTVISRRLPAASGNVLVRLRATSRPARPPRQHQSVQSPILLDFQVSEFPLVLGWVWVHYVCSERGESPVPVFGICWRDPR